MKALRRLRYRAPPAPRSASCGCIPLRFAMIRCRRGVALHLTALGIELIGNRIVKVARADITVQLRISCRHLRIFLNLQPVTHFFCLTILRKSSQRISTVAQRSMIVPVVLKMGYVMAGRQKLTRRQRALRDGVLVPIAALCFIVISSLGITWVITEPIFHPNRHPTINRFFYFMQHQHPRLSRALFFSPFGLLIGLKLLEPFVPTLMSWQLEKQRLTGGCKLESTSHLNCPLIQTFNLDAATAWKNLSVTLPGMAIAVHGIRSTNWQLVEDYERRLQMRLRLTYFHEVTGSKSGQMYPRTVNCLCTISGKGMKSDVSLVYSADSAMDNKTVREIIDQTNSALQVTLNNETVTAARLAIDALVKKYRESDNSVEDASIQIAQSATEQPSEPDGWKAQDTPSLVPEYKFYLSA